MVVDESNIQAAKHGNANVVSALGVRIKGIYATALTELLLENGIDVVDASPQLKARFGDAVHSRGVALATIKDREDRRGLVIVGRGDLVQRVLEVLRRSLQLSPIIVMPGELYATYVCRVVEGGFVELPNGLRGVLDGRGEVGELLTAHIVTFRDGVPVLRRGVAVVGMYARLVEGGPSDVSEHIRGPQRALLLSLADKAGLEGWGVRWRSSARWASLDELIEELQRLKEGAREARERARTCTSPAKVTEGEVLAFVPLSLDDKRLLDTVRARRVRTVPYHHLAKACGERYSALVDALEGFAANREGEDLAGKVLELLEGDMAGGSLRVLHEVPGSRVVKIEGTAQVVARRPLTILLHRRIAAGGAYDGLQVAKEEGDTAISIVTLGSYVLPHAYFNAEGKLKGVYVNVNTPIEPCPPSAVWYIDAYIDVVWSRDQGPRVIDEEKLEESGVFTHAAISGFRDIAYKVAEALKTNEERLLRDPVPLLKELTVTANFFTRSNHGRTGAPS